MTDIDGTTVRLATVADLARIGSAWHAMRLEAGLTDEELVPDWRRSLSAFLTDRITQGSAVVWLAERTGVVAGTTLALLKDDYPYCLFHPGTYGFIGCVYTRPEFRGLGIATELVGRAVEWLGAQGVRRIRLLPTEASRAMYERFGFRPVEDLDLLLP